MTALREDRRAGVAVAAAFAVTTALLCVVIAAAALGALELLDLGLPGAAVGAVAGALLLLGVGYALPRGGRLWLAFAILAAALVAAPEPEAAGPYDADPGPVEATILIPFLLPPMVAIAIGQWLRRRREH